MSQVLQTASISAPDEGAVKLLHTALLSCSQCKLSKPCTDFPKATGKFRGYAWICKKCKKQKLLAKKTSMSNADWLLQNRKYWLKSQHNLSLDAYNALLINQNHKCAICSCDEAAAFKGLLFVDHCHSTKKVRGLLCHHCNTALGKFKDSSEILSKAIKYLESQ